MIKIGHIGAACAFLDLGFSPEMVKTAFINQGMSEAEAEYLVKEAAPLGLLMGAIKGIGGLFGRAAVKGAPRMLQAGEGLLAQGGRGAAQMAAKNPGMMTNITKAPGMFGAETGSVTGKLMQGGAASRMAGGALHNVGAAAQHGLAGFQGGGLLGGLKHLGGGALNFGKGMFFMGSKNPSLANMAGKGYGMYGMGSMLLGPGSTPMPSPQQY
jgi:hypothetical protein